MSQPEKSEICEKCRTITSHCLCVVNDSKPAQDGALLPKPCPFCGNAPTLFPEYDIVKCRHCGGVCLPSSVWNTRATSEPREPYGWLCTRTTGSQDFTRLKPTMEMYKHHGWEIQPLFK